MSESLHLENIAKAKRAVESKRDAVRMGEMRQEYHFMPEAGWMNDPNGLIFYRGRYHFFYQFNPYDACWSAMHWGHAVSEDLVHFEYLPVALAPSEDYDYDERGGCFSGSAIEYEGKLYLFYTGVADRGNGLEQTQCVAFSEDGIYFQKYEGNPVICAPDGYSKADFRDPKVWEHEGVFYMVCGASKEGRAQALLFRSADLVNWEFVNVMLESRGELGTMFECPDIFRLEDKYVFLCSPIGLGDRKAIYMVGDMDYKTGRFHPHTMGETDWGFDFYASQSFQDAKERRILTAWANGWNWMPWWKDFGPTGKEGWCGFFVLPRTVELEANGMLSFRPVEELKSLRRNGKTIYDVEIEGDTYVIETKSGIWFEWKANIDLKNTTASELVLILRSDSTRESLITIALDRGELLFDRNNSDQLSSGRTRSPLSLIDKNTIDIHIFSDSSSIEVFADNYRISHSCNIFPSENQNRNMICAVNGKAVLSSMEIYELCRKRD